MYRAIVLALLIILSGCAASAPATPTESPPTPSPTVTTSPTVTASPTPAPTPTATPTSTPPPPPPDNAWQADPIRVEIIAPDDSRADHRGMVREAVRFWENQTTGRELNYTIVDGPYSDITVRFVEDIGHCEDEEGEAVGCADVVQPGTTVEGVTYIEVERGFTRDTTVKILKHEFGHTLGYLHSDADRFAFMEATTTTTYVSQPDAVDRPSPWLVDELLIYIDDGELAGSNQPDYRRQVGYALDYYRNSDDSNLPSGTSLSLTDNRSAAHIILHFDENGPFNSTAYRWGVDNDEDPEFEYYTRGEITVAGVDEDHVGWHVGYWLGTLFGAESTEDLPPPFDEPEDDDRDRWW